VHSSYSYVGRVCVAALIDSSSDSTQEIHTNIICRLSLWLPVPSEKSHDDAKVMWIAGFKQLTHNVNRHNFPTYSKGPDTIPVAAKPIHWDQFEVRWSATTVSRVQSCCKICQTHRSHFELILGYKMKCVCRKYRLPSRVLETNPASTTPTASSAWLAAASVTADDWLIDLPLSGSYNSVSDTHIHTHC